jgi:membrane-bound serine protease (ClpP class)
MRPRSPLPPGRALAPLRPLLSLALALLGLLLGAARGALPSLGDRPGAVIIVPIHGTIDLGLAPFVQRALDEHPGAAAIVLDVDTFGGRVDAAVQIRDALLEAEVPVIAYVNRRAISAGALISLSADTLAFAPGASMGAATPVQLEGGEATAVDEKTVSYMRSEMRATAEATGRDGALAEAMVDASLEVPGISEAGKLLTLSTEQAVQVGLADGVADDLDALLAAVGLQGAERVTLATSWSEDVARMLTAPEVAGLLMSIGFLGVMVELYQPGFGLPGVVGISCLGLFFFGHMTAHLAGWEELLILLLGLVALAIEAFVLPGFGVVGVGGALLVLLALTLALVGAPLEVAWDLGLIGEAFGRVVVGLAVTAVAFLALMVVLPARRLPKWMVLDARITASAPGTVSSGDSHTVSHGADLGLFGRPGRALTDLRLSGKAEIDGRVVDVVSQHEYIDRDTPIVVVEVEGVRVVVARPAADPRPT